MDKQKSPVVKSNSTSETKKYPQKANKKSRSDAEFQAKTTTTIRSEGILRRRGVYVEKKMPKMLINDMKNRDQSPEALPNKTQTPPRVIPRPGRKLFLSSVLNILSQSTTGTQCPDITDRLRKMATKTKLRRRKIKEGDNQEDLIASPNNSKAKPKYRYKISSNYDSEIDQVVVLQSTKEIKMSSNDLACVSGKDSLNIPIDRGTVTWAHGLAPLNQKKLDTAEPEATTSKRNIENEPSKIPAELPKKDDKKIHIFFEEIIKTPSSVYNMKTEHDQRLPNCANSSKANQDMGEAVASKPNSRTIKETYQYDTSQTSNPKYYYSIVPDEEQEWDGQELEEHFQPRKSKRIRMPEKRRKVKSNSFNYEEKEAPFPKTTSFTTPHKKKAFKRDAKEEFINMLKTELLKQELTYDQPQNFYQALKVISRNKRRCQKSMHFGGSTKPSEGDVHVCQFKRRKVLSGKSSDKQSRYNPESRFDSATPIYTSHRKRAALNSPDKYSDDDLLTPSLEVLGYDYQPARTQGYENWAQRPKDYENCSQCPPTPPTAIEFYNRNIENGSSIFMSER